jgi:hypothetical protein
VLPLDHLKRYNRASPQRCHSSIVKELGRADIAFAVALAFLVVIPKSLP